MTLLQMETKLRHALKLLEQVPKMAGDAAQKSGNNSVSFVLHAKIEPFVDATRELLRRHAKAKVKP